MAAPVIDSPQVDTRALTPRQRTSSNAEFYSWVFMRISGIILIGLIFTHLGIMHLLEGGVARVNFAFVCGRWSGPFWQTWDWAQLFLATLHGANGMRWIIRDYVRNPQGRFWSLMTLYTIAMVMLALGTITIVTFSPVDCAPATVGGSS